MKESKFYQEILAEGREEGRTEGRIEGVLEAKRASIVEVIDERFGAKAAAEVGEILQTIDNAQQLSDLHRRAIRTRRLADLRRVLPKAGASS